MKKTYDLSEDVINGDLPGAKAITMDLLEAGMEAKKIIDEALIPGMEKVGKMFQENELFVPEMMMTAMTMHVKSCWIGMRVTLRAWSPGINPCGSLL